MVENLAPGLVQALSGTRNSWDIRAQTSDRKLHRHAGRSTHCDIERAVAITTFLIAMAPLLSRRFADFDGRLRKLCRRADVAGRARPSPPPFTPLPHPKPRPIPSRPSRCCRPTSRRVRTSRAPRRMYGGARSVLPPTAPTPRSGRCLRKPEAEAKVAKQCAEFGRGGCQVVSFSGQECVALATFIGILPAAALESVLYRGRP